MKKTLFVMFLLIGVMAIFVGMDQAADASEQAKLTPLQVTTKVSEEWKRTGKQFIGSWEGYGQRALNSCGRCHDGFVFTTQNADLPDIRWGNETPPASANQKTKANPVRPHAQGITCQACHAGFGKELMDAGTVETVSLGTVTGVGKGATCFYCHDGRYAKGANDKTVAETLYKGYLAGGTGNLNLNGIHYLAAGALVSGFGGMEYPDVKYPTGAHSRLENSCVDCHMPTTNEGYATHSFKMSGNRQMNNAFLQAACADCHTMIGEKYVDDFQASIAFLADQIRAEISRQLKVRPDFGAGGTTLTKLDGSGTIAFNRQNVTLEQYVALYNLQLITSRSASSYHAGTYEKAIYNSPTRAGDGSMGVHNPPYARALLQESLKRLQASAK